MTADDALRPWWKPHLRPVDHVASEIDPNGRGIMGFDVPWLKAVASTERALPKESREGEWGHAVKQLAQALLVCRLRIGQDEAELKALREKVAMYEGQNRREE